MPPRWFGLRAGCVWSLSEKSQAVTLLKSLSCRQPSTSSMVLKKVQSRMSALLQHLNLPSSVWKNTWDTTRNGTAGIAFVGLKLAEIRGTRPALPWNKSCAPLPPIPSSCRGPEHLSLETQRGFEKLLLGYRAHEVSSLVPTTTKFELVKTSKCAPAINLLLTCFVRADLFNGTYESVYFFLGIVVMDRCAD